ELNISQISPTAPTPAFSGSNLLAVRRRAPEGERLLCERPNPRSARRRPVPPRTPRTGVGAGERLPEAGLRDETIPPSGCPTASRPDPGYAGGCFVPQCRFPRCKVERIRSDNPSCERRAVRRTDRLRPRLAESGGRAAAIRARFR